ncbi:MAG: sulfatase-like hydrolase/transferase [Phycisphaerales bacterium]|nr:MAG: sulfatase-like hydrolase/transferase [Phycisphaerales bacterium]
MPSTWRRVSCSQRGVTHEARVIRSCALLLVGMILLTGACRREEKARGGGGGRSLDLAGALKAAAKIGGTGRNVLLVSVDTTRADKIACYGHPTIKTPNIDRMAREGTRFAQCISAAPLTLVSHASLLTGSYQYVHGVRNNGSYQVADENVTLAEIFKKAGHATHAQVATVVLDREHKLDQGFDTYQDVKSLNEEVQRAGKEPIPERKAEDITLHGIRLLRQNRDGPFFIFLHYYDPHLPYRSPEPFLSQYEDKYLGEIAYFDHQFGILVDEVRRLGLEENTLVILVSDHGEGLGEHGEEAHQYFLWDTTQHVPLIMWGADVPAGQVVESQVRLIDIMSTIVDYVDLEPSKQMQGKSLLPLLAAPHLDLELPTYADTLNPTFTLDYSALRFVRDQGWKYIHAPQPRLYNTAEDPHELNNLAGQQPMRVEGMKQLLRDIIVQSPRPPAGRSTPSRASEAQLKQLEAIGYFGVGNVEDEGMEGDEIDDFEPVGKDPHDHTEAFILVNRAGEKRRSNQLEEAVACYEKLFEMEPASTMVAHQLAETLAQLGRHHEAIDIFKKAIELGSQSSGVHIQLASVCALLGGDYAVEAEKEYRRAIEINPEYARAHLGLALLLNTTAETPETIEQSLREFAAADMLDPENPDILFPWGRALFNLGRLPEAAEKLQKAVEFGSDIAQTRSTLGVVLYNLGRVEEAQRHFEALIDSDPRDVVSYHRLAQCYRQKGDLAKACENLFRTIDLDPENMELRLELGRTLLQAGRTDEAFDILERALDMRPGDVQVGLTYVRALQAHGRQGKALETGQELLESALDNGPLYGEVALLLSRSGRRADAIELLREAYERLPEDWAVANDLAWHLATSPDQSLRDGGEALRLAEQANLATDGGNAGVLDTLAAANAEVGRFDEAIETARRALALARQTQAEELAKKIESRLKMYERHQPFRDQ